MADTRVRLGEIELKNPVIPASGTFGYGREFAELFDLNILGGIAVKGTTIEAKAGNESPRIAEAAGGMINSVGLQNPGATNVATEQLPGLAEIFDGVIIANISGFSERDYAACAEIMDSCPQAHIVEVNISCPNVSGGGMAFGQSSSQAAAVTKAVKQVTDKPVYIKLSPNVTDVASIAAACEEAGADGISLINTLQAMRIDIKTRKPVLANITGGLSGTCHISCSAQNGKSGKKSSGYTNNGNGRHSLGRGCDRDDYGRGRRGADRRGRTQKPVDISGNNSAAASAYGAAWHR